MRKLIAFVFVLLLSCSIPELEADNTVVDLRSKFVGRWIGNEKDQQEKGLEKHWILDRFDDGTYSIHFNTNRLGQIEEFTEDGKWWIQDGKLFEHCSFMETPDVYSFSFIDDKTLKIKIISSPMPMENPGYEVVDTKIGKAPENPPPMEILP